MNVGITADAGSFRDPANRVYSVEKHKNGEGKRILRGLDKESLDNFKRLSEQGFYREFVKQGQVVNTDILPSSDPDAIAVLKDGWSGVLEHATIPFVSYPYEWTFSMLKDAALLQLNILEQSLENNWTLKDATPYNIQFEGSRPVFIDIPSFEPWVKGEPWVGYRQFCTMFLTPLMLKSHLGIDQLPILRSYLDGIPPTEAIKYFTGIRKFKKGVMSHIVFPAKVENSISSRERDDAPARRRTGREQSPAMIIGLVQSLSRLVRSLKSSQTHSDWSQYDKTHSYEDADFDAKKTFIDKHASQAKREQIWDIGCNTGTFSKICSPYCNSIISIDGDHDAVERLYLEGKQNKGSNILPLVMNLSNISPGQGWAGSERRAFDKRKSPDLVLCLALIHHIRLSANIPNLLFLKWLRSLNSDVIMEFVNREDEMVIKLLTNKREQYDDYTLDQFIDEAGRYFIIKDRKPLKGGNRELFFLSPS